MKTLVVKKLVENYTQEQLVQAEEAVLREQPLPIAVEGNDDSERLSYLLAAIFILDKIKQEKMEFKTALRSYTERVRESIN